MLASIRDSTIVQTSDGAFIKNNTSLAVVDLIGNQRNYTKKTLQTQQKQANTLLKKKT